MRAEYSCAIIHLTFALKQYILVHQSEHGLYLCYVIFCETKTPYRAIDINCSVSFNAWRSKIGYFWKQ